MFHVSFYVQVHFLRRKSSHSHKPTKLTLEYSNQSLMCPNVFYFLSFLIFLLFLPEVQEEGLLKSFALWRIDGWIGSMSVLSLFHLIQLGCNPIVNVSLYRPYSLRGWCRRMFWWIVAIGTSQQYTLQSLYALLLFLCFDG